jgi:hypothetical protein
MADIDNIVKVKLPPNKACPDKEVMEVLSKGFFGGLNLIASEWVNWAIDYLDSPLPYAEYRCRPDFLYYYKYCMVLQEACTKYLEGNYFE